ncbi:glycosyltransferase [Herbiconiux moechotypicola]|uniref:Glycosyltransferase n=1 Tax=Herbiconiux moechotypicola TaxID=637393 RepID=A0ABN3DEE1_9MICO|nr:glycosyltransferase [Herbiconiux moechotypicola]MCS5729258.1 glycosyltransferase [Herbiconiux moechotypicola]
MSTILVCSSPIHGHVSPLLTAAAHLVSSGHRVVMLTGSRFARRVTDAGAEFRPLDGIADFDDRDVPSYLPERERYRGLAQAQYDIQNIFVKTIPDQYRSVQRIVDELRPDAVLVDGAFGGVGPLLLRDGPRPPVLALGVTPLTQRSRDVAPAGTGIPPSSTLPGRVRNRVLDVVARRILFRRTQRVAEQIFAGLGIDHLELFVMDISSAFDRFMQLSPPEFEYPRSDLAPNTVFVGAMPLGAAAAPGGSGGAVGSAGAALPEWWGDLDGTRPVVHVTQGTIDNHDLERLIRPTLEGLAALDVLVVVSLGGRAPDALGPVPANARVASYLPYDRLLPLTSVFVTNGGYGGVQQALAAGVPLVVAGDTEDKPEVAARVAWSGVGVDLHTGTPTAAAVRGAVERVLDRDAGFGAAAGRMAAASARYDTLANIEREIAAAVETWPQWW